MNRECRSESGAGVDGVEVRSRDGLVSGVGQHATLAVPDADAADRGRQSTSVGGTGEVECAGVGAVDCLGGWW